MVTVVGGPNARTDYHINPTEEFFFQLKGTVKVRIQHEGKPHDVVLPEELDLSFARQCAACTDARPGYGRADHRAHPQERHDGYASLVLRKVQQRPVRDRPLSIEVLERDMPPVFDAYYSDPENQHCKKCGHINPGRPK